MGIPRSLMDWGREARKGLMAERCKDGTRKNLAVFRGSPTGGCESFDQVRGLQKGDGSVLPRYAVVALSKRRPDLIDARFSNAPDDCWPNELRARDMVDSARMTDEQQSCYSAI